MNIIISLPNTFLIIDLAKFDLIILWISTLYLDQPSETQYSIKLISLGKYCCLVCELLHWIIRSLYAIFCCWKFQFVSKPTSEYDPLPLKSISNLSKTHWKYSKNNISSSSELWAFKTYLSYFFFSIYSGNISIDLYLLDETFHFLLPVHLGNFSRVFYIGKLH